MVLARPILVTWLGPRFGVAATAMTLLVGYWLFNANTGVAGSMLLAAGRARQLTVYSAAVAALNLALSLALTPSLGLNGVVLGTTLSYALGFPFFIALTLSAIPVTLGELAREAWLPSYLTGAALAGGLIAVRSFVSLESMQAVLGVAAPALVAYWATYYAVWLRPSERTLFKNVAWTIIRR
jgi:O-antigen/teichoic acid export membrane protein